MRNVRYSPRVVDAELDELAAELPAILIEGAKGVGKTATALQRAATVRALDSLSQRSAVAADTRRALEGPHPVLFDEWQHVPELWDRVRRAVDAGAEPGSFLLTGSVVPSGLGTHSGAGRIVTVRMRPMALSERVEAPPTVSLGAMLTGARPEVGGATSWRLEHYVDAILSSGFPGLRGLSSRSRRAQLDGYIARIVDQDLPELGHAVRNPVLLTRWMRAYAAAASSSASFERIRDAATAGHADKPAKTTTIPYRDALERLWIIDSVPAWLPSRRPISRLSAPPKHQLVDPAVAARLLGVDAERLLDGDTPDTVVPREGFLLGALFESLVTLSVRVYAQSLEANVRHLRTSGGDREVDLIIERSDGRVVAIEVKLARSVNDHDTRHLRWLAERIGDDLLDAVIVTTGGEAYRRKDGIAVVPAALLGA